MSEYEIYEDAGYGIVCMRTELSGDRILVVRLMDYGAGIREIIMNREDHLPVVVGILRRLFTITVKLSRYSSVK